MDKRILSPQRVHIALYKPLDFEADVSHKQIVSSIENRFSLKNVLLVYKNEKDSAEEEYFIKNHLGSTVTLIDKDGNPAGTVYDYFPYGKQKEVVAAPENVTQTFTGKELDLFEKGSANGEDGEGWYYFGARNLDADLGIWTSTDPADQFWNAYSYSNNPINSIDPDGREVYPNEFIGPLNVGDVRAYEVGLPSDTRWTGFQIFTNNEFGIHFPTEGDAGTFAGYLGDYANYPNEVSSFIVQRQGFYHLTPFVLSDVKDAVNPGVVPVMATGVFHTHVNDQLSLSIGDEAYGRTQRLNMYMRNPKHQVSDYKPWNECEVGFEPLNINP